MKKNRAEEIEKLEKKLDINIIVLLRLMLKEKISFKTSNKLITTNKYLVDSEEMKIYIDEEFAELNINDAGKEWNFLEK